MKEVGHFNKLILLCFPGSQLKLEFDEQDALSYFAAIAAKSSTA